MNSRARSISITLVAVVVALAMLTLGNGLGDSATSGHRGDQPGAVVEAPRQQDPSHPSNGQRPATWLATTIATTQQSVASTLAALRTNSGGADPRYYGNGVWVDGSYDCFRCTLGPALLSAAQSASSNDPVARAEAIQSFSKAIRTHQHRNGAVVPAAPGESGPGIQTLYFATELANSYLLERADLSDHQREVWRRSIVRAARWLIRDGDTRYYVNGNINLGISMLLDVSARISGATDLRQAARRSIRFTLHPTGRFASYGLRYTVVPKRHDDADGAGYLGESGGGRPGFDAAYTLMQSNLAAQWFVMTGNPTAKRLANLFYNQLWPRVRTSDWSIDVSGGTRRPTAGVRYPFVTSALPVLALWGGRTDLQPLVASQVNAMLNSYRGATTYAHDGMSYGYGLEMGTAVQALTLRPQSRGLRAAISAW